MWDDFQIGEDNGGCSAFNIGAGLSHNSECYWWRCDYFGGKIEKETEEGRKITEMLKSETHLNKIESYIYEIGIKRLSGANIMRIISNAETRGFENGRRHQAEKIREHLNYGGSHDL